MSPQNPTDYEELNISDEDLASIPDAEPAIAPVPAHVVLGMDVATEKDQSSAPTISAADLNLSELIDRHQAETQTVTDTQEEESSSDSDESASDEVVTLGYSLSEFADRVQTAETEESEISSEDEAAVEAEVKAILAEFLPQAYLLPGSVEPLTAAIESRMLELGEDRWEQQAATPGTVDYNLSTARTYYGAENARLKAALDFVADKSKLKSEVRSNGKVLFGRKSKKDLQPIGKVLTDRNQAMLEFNRRAPGMGLDRFPLYNSGLWIDIIEPTRAALHSFYSQIGEASAVYGRQYGAHYYMYADLFIKQQFAMLMEEHIVGCNLKGWRRGQSLWSKIALPDFPMLFLAMAHMMYPKGFPEFAHICINKMDDGTRCYATTRQTIDISLLAKHNFGMLPEECLLILSQKEVSPDDLVRYQKVLNLRKSFRFNQWGVELKVPTVLEHLDFGMKFNQQLLDDVQNTLDNDALARATDFQYYKLYTPWVKAVATYQSKPGEEDVLDMATPLPDVIAVQMDRILHQDPQMKLRKHFEDFINSSAVSHAVYESHECPKCKRLPDESPEFVTVDPIRAFFTILLRKLIPTS